MSEYVFEGTPVVDHQAKLPSITVDCDHYPAGTELRLAMTVRVRGVNHEEDKEGNFIRSHKLGIQAIEVVSSYNPADARDQVSGGLAAGAISDDDDTGLSPGRTGDQWPSGIAKDPSTGKVVDTETGEVIEDEGDASSDGEAASEAASEDAEEDAEEASEVPAADEEPEDSNDDEADDEASSERELADVGF